MHFSIIFMGLCASAWAHAENSHNVLSHVHHHSSKNVKLNPNLVPLHILLGAEVADQVHFVPLNPMDTVNGRTPNPLDAEAGAGPDARLADDTQNTPTPADGIVTSRLVTSTVTLTMPATPTPAAGVSGSRVGTRTATDGISGSSSGRNFPASRTISGGEGLAGGNQLGSNGTFVEDSSSQPRSGTPSLLGHFSVICSLVAILGILILVII